MSKAIELAKQLEDGHGWELQEETAAELRRLAEVALDREALARHCEKLEADNAALRERLDAIYSTEPVAWINYSALTGNRRLDFACESEIASTPLIPLPEKP